MINRNRRLARQRLDSRLTVLPSADKFAVPRRGWLRAVRDALGMTGSQMAARMGITPQSVGDLERSEAQGSIRLSTLRRAAEALDCTLVYAIVPRRPLQEMVRDRARARARRELGYIDRTMELEDQAVDQVGFDERIADYIRENIRETELWDER
jgi:predicted DNA-binding mobile mystery protein A